MNQKAQRRHPQTMLRCLAPVGVSADAVIDVPSAAAKKPKQRRQPSKDSGFVSEFVIPSGDAKPARGRRVSRHVVPPAPVAKKTPQKTCEDPENRKKPSSVVAAKRRMPSKEVPEPEKAPKEPAVVAPTPVAKKAVVPAKRRMPSKEVVAEPEKAPKEPAVVAPAPAPVAKKAPQKPRRVASKEVPENPDEATAPKRRSSSMIAEKTVVKEDEDSKVKHEDCIKVPVKPRRVSNRPANRKRSDTVEPFKKNTSEENLTPAGKDLKIHMYDELERWQKFYDAHGITLTDAEKVLARRAILDAEARLTHINKVPPRAVVAATRPSARPAVRPGARRVSDDVKRSEDGGKRPSTSRHGVPHDFAKDIKIAKGEMLITTSTEHVKLHNIFKHYTKNQVGVSTDKTFGSIMDKDSAGMSQASFILFAHQYRFRLAFFQLKSIYKIACAHTPSAMGGNLLNFEGFKAALSKMGHQAWTDVNGADGTEEETSHEVLRHMGVAKVKTAIVKHEPAEMEPVESEPVENEAAELVM
eukprot:Platyproteum_vivax@DN6626_c0_g1_i3.p1